MTLRARAPPQPAPRFSKITFRSATSYRTSGITPKPLVLLSDISGLDLAFVTSSPSIGYTACMDGLAIPEEKRGYPDSRWQKRLSVSFAYASLACSLSLWLALGLFYLQGALHFSLPGWKWIASLPGWTWPPVELFATFLSIVAAALHLHSKLWRIALPVSSLMFLFTMYVMGS